MTPPLPLGFRLRPDPQTRRLARGHLIVGGTPRRALRLSDDGARLAAALLDGAAVATPADAALARRLLDAGVAQPVPPRTDATPTVQVVVPTFDDAAALHRCLTALTDNLDVLVVDDGSRHADEVAGVAAATGAHLLRRPHNDGPAAARNAGAAATSADVVAFVDSDVVVDADALRALLAHLRDPAVVAVAPRVQAVPG